MISSPYSTLRSEVITEVDFLSKLKLLVEYHHFTATSCDIASSFSLAHPKTNHTAEIAKQLVLNKIIMRQGNMLEILSC